MLVDDDFVGGLTVADLPVKSVAKMDPPVDSRIEGGDIGGDCTKTACRAPIGCHATSSPSAADLLQPTNVGLSTSVARVDCGLTYAAKAPPAATSSRPILETTSHTPGGRVGAPDGGELVIERGGALI